MKTDGERMTFLGNQLNKINNKMSSLEKSVDKLLEQNFQILNNNECLSRELICNS